jgi:hypothetical protein
MKTRYVKLMIMVTALLGAGLYTSCSSDDDADTAKKTELETTIAEANLLLTTTHEGVAAGNFQRGSQDELAEAIAIAQVIADLPEVKQSTVTGANANLEAAIVVYNSKIIEAIDPANLVGQWTFDELTTAAAGTTVKDYSGNGRDGTIKIGNAGLLPAGSGTAALGADRYGVSGKALLLDKGANVEIPYNVAFNSPSMSFTAWVKLSEVRNNRFIGLQSWIGYKFEVQDGNRPFLSIGHSGGTYDRDAGVAIGQDAWYHLAVTYTAGSMKFYINGILIPAGTWTNTPNAAAALPTPYNLVLGCDFPTDKYAATPANFDVVGHADYHKIPAEWGGYLHGSLDEVRIYKSVLSPTQVTSIYELEKPN